MQKVLVVNGSSYYRPFAQFGELESNVDVLFKNPESIRLVVFTGGEDVSPNLYNEELNPQTYHNPRRDEFEVKVFKETLKQKLPIAGICRGAQLICALSGGKLVQDITNHGGYHDVRTDDGRLIEVSSTHHQMQLPPADAIAVAWAEPKRSKHYHGAPGVEYTPDKEHDVVYYPSTNALGMQYHPEFMSKDSEGFLYCGELVERFLKLKPTK